MDYTVTKINDTTWRIDDGGVRFFLLAGTENALLVDSGMTVRNAKEIAESLTDRPVKLLNTHADRDHTGSNEEFAEFYMHPDEAENYAASGKSGKIVPVRGGDCIDLGERPLEIVELPGHTPGSIGVLDRRDRVLISGDPIQQNGNIFMFGRFRNFEKYVASLEALLPLTDRFDEIWPSHAEIPVSPSILPALIEGAKRIQAGEIEGTPVEMHGREIRRCDIGATAFLCEKNTIEK